MCREMERGSFVSRERAGEVSAGAAETLADFPFVIN